jgi:hypothetical protein
VSNDGKSDEQKRADDIVCVVCGRPLNQREWVKTTSVWNIAAGRDETVWVCDRCRYPKPVAFALAPECPTCKGARVVHDIPVPPPRRPDETEAERERRLFDHILSERPCPDCSPVTPHTGK